MQQACPIQDSPYSFLQDSQIDLESPHFDPAVVAVSTSLPPGTMNVSTFVDATRKAKSAFTMTNSMNVTAIENSLLKSGTGDIGLVFSHAQQQQQQQSRQGPVPLIDGKITEWNANDLRVNNDGDGGSRGIGMADKNGFAHAEQRTDDGANYNNRYNSNNNAMGGRGGARGFRGGRGGSFSNGYARRGIGSGGSAARGTGSGGSSARGTGSGGSVARGGFMNGDRMGYFRPDQQQQDYTYENQSRDYRSSVRGGSGTGTGGRGGVGVGVGTGTGGRGGVGVGVGTGTGGRGGVGIGGGGNRGGTGSGYRGGRGSGSTQPSSIYSGGGPRGMNKAHRSSEHNGFPGRPF